MILQQVKNKLLLTLITIVHLFNYLHLFLKKVKINLLQLDIMVRIHLES